MFVWVHVRACVCVCVCVYARVCRVPGKHRGIWPFRLLLMLLTDVKRSQIHPQQFCYPLSTIDIPVLIQHLHTRSHGQNSYNITIDCTT